MRRDNRWTWIELGFTVAIVALAMLLAATTADARTRTVTLPARTQPTDIAATLVGRSPDFVSMCDANGCDGWALGDRWECRWTSFNRPNSVRVTATCTLRLRRNH